MVVEISLNGGAWTRLDSNVGTGNNYNTLKSYAWYNSSSTNGPIDYAKFTSINGGEGNDMLYSSQNAGWIQSATRLTGSAGLSNVRFRFTFGSDISGNDEGWAIDDIEVIDISTPTNPATAVVLSNITNTSTRVSWTRGDGEGVLVVARLSATPAVSPVNDLLYTANNVFGAQDSTGTGNYVVYSGSGSTVVVSGLSQLTDYAYDVYEYNGKYMHVNFIPSAASNNATTLPVTLTSFTAAAKGNDVVLNWNTASEVNNKGFEIERSVDGRSFEKIDFVKGYGNSSRMISYNLKDDKAFAEAGSQVLYYRLKQLDFDNRFAYSQVVKVSRVAEKANAFSAFPNPFNTSYTVSFDAAEAAEVIVRMTDLQGRTVNEQTVQAAKGNNQFSFDNLGGLQSGIYFVKLTIGGEMQVLKLVKH
jgi:hypothetical protein